MKRDEIDIEQQQETDVYIEGEVVGQEEIVEKVREEEVSDGDI